MKKIADWYQQIMINVMKRLTTKDILIILVITIVLLIIAKLTGEMSSERWLKI
ncbi:hypothetical protein [Caecibacteroides pullorum]|jgi:hypothetical protein|uniref:Uncharacterized protein n=1 Tax=Caecibacteroides pullorum TaxID=2725562 RepID=A0AA40ZRW2_9BACT|nr:hypothetical protein [Caecibacteroides pullorum]MBM6856445.1 hypothetical protein [Caecibacteroides pullorum]MBV8040362.1 hypothetical protein [Caecibacteroides pullorum]MBV8057451.1 hypothetical protein [Caecibacteroides pullorum]